MITSDVYDGKSQINVYMNETFLIMTCVVNGNNYLCISNKSH